MAIWDNLLPKSIQIPEGYFRGVSIKPFLLWDTPLTANNYPITNVSWNDALEICNSLSKKLKLEEAYSLSPEAICWNKLANGFRLPTELEWEWACMGGGTKDPYGPIDDIAWHAENSDRKIHPVKQKQPNNYGLYDMLGNVYEWCWDPYNAIEDNGLRAIRGEGCSAAPIYVLAALHWLERYDFQSNHLSFRCARTITDALPFVRQPYLCQILFK